MKNQTAQYKFVRPSGISDYLKCPICLQVFKNAMRLYCGHTFCNICLNDYMKQGKTCPQCRTIIDVKNIGNDLLARQIINQFQVFCPAEDCPWKGMLQQLQNHINKECYFGDINNNKDKKVKKNQKIVWHETVDEQILDKINQHTAKGSLQARVLAKTDSLREVFPLKQQKPTHSTQKKLKKQTKKNQKKTNQPNPQPRSSNFDFLSSLFE